MRTLPKSLSEFRQLIESRGNALRKLDYRQLQQKSDEPVEELTIDSRRATIATIVEVMPDNSLRVVVQGFMNALLIGENVALDGFYKHPDGSVGQMREEQFHEFD